MLNIEKYEYMNGLYDAEGLKLLLHHQDAMPIVKDFGIDLTAGLNTFVGVSVSKVSSILVCF